MRQSTQLVTADGVPVSTDNPLPVDAVVNVDTLNFDTGGIAQETTLGLFKTANHNDLDAINTTLAAGIPVTGTFWQATQPVSGSFYQATQPVSAANLPLPSGAATSAKQDTGNTSLSSIDGKLVATAQRTVTIDTVTTSGSVTAGKKSVTFIFSSDFTGAVGSSNFNGAVDNTIEIIAPHTDTLGSISYTITTGNIRLITVA